MDVSEQDPAVAPLPTASRHSCDNPDWITPSWLVELARTVMGSIDLDPASDAEAQEVVRAGTYYTAEDDGLARPWYGNVFLNPPGGQVSKFWLRLVSYNHTFKTSERIDQAIWVGYSLEQLQTLQGLTIENPLYYPICVPKRRIAFVENRAMRATRIERLLAKGEAAGATAAARKVAADIRAGKEPPNSPSHANYVSYLGPYVDRFAHVFSGIGKVRR